MRKKLVPTLIITNLVIIALFLMSSTGILISTGTGNPDGSAMLEIKSTDKGFLPPRLTTTQRDNISTPAEGLIVFNTTTDGLEQYNGSSWARLVDNDVAPVRYTANSSSFSYSANTITIVNFTGKTYDDDNLVSTGSSWKYTAPKSGYYNVNTMVSPGKTTIVSEQELFLYKNGTSVAALDVKWGKDLSSTNTFGNLNGSSTIYLSENDELNVRLRCPNASSPYNNAVHNYIEINYLGE